MASMPAGSASADGGPRPAPRRLGYLRRHWRGQLSLATSFWLNGVLTGLVLVPLVAYLLSRVAIWAVQGQQALIAASAVVVALAFPWPLMVWQLVGIWRSAGRTHRERSRRFGPWLARGAVVVCALVGLIGGAMLVGKRLPLIGELYRAASGDTERGERRYAVTLGGRELILAGPIAIGSVREVKERLARHPQVAVLRLEGPGGRIAPARELRDLVEARGLSTYVGESCNSACAFIFIGGKERILRKGARLGFHRLALAGMSDSEMDAQAAQEREAMRQRGIAGWFIDKALSTPFEKIWYPTEEELVRAGVVTRVTDGREFGVNPLAFESMAALDSELARLPVPAAIKQTQPKRYETFLKDAGVLMREGAAQGDFDDLLRSMVAEAMAEAALRTSDAAARDYARVLASRQRMLAERAPALCGRDGAADVDLGEEAKTTHQEALAQVIADEGATEPVGDEARARDMLRRIGERIAREHGRDTAHLLAVPPSDPEQGRAYCEALAILFEALASAQEPRAGAALRWLLAQQSGAAEAGQ